MTAWDDKPKKKKKKFPLPPSKASDSVRIRSTATRKVSEKNGVTSDKYDSKIHNTNKRTGVASRLTTNETNGVLKEQYSKYDPKSGNFEQESYDSSDGKGYRGSTGSTTLPAVKAIIKPTKKADKRARQDILKSIIKKKKK